MPTPETTPRPTPSAWYCVYLGGHLIAATSRYSYLSMPGTEGLSDWMHAQGFRPAPGAVVDLTAHTWEMEGQPIDTLVTDAPHHTLAHALIL